MGLQEQPRDEKGQFTTTGGLGAWADKRSQTSSPGQVMAGAWDRINALTSRKPGFGVQREEVMDIREQQAEDRDDTNTDAAGLKNLEQLINPRGVKELQDFVKSSAKTATSVGSLRDQSKAKLDKLLS